MPQSKKILIIILTIIALAGLIVGVVVASHNQKPVICSGYEVRIVGNEKAMLTPKMVDEFIGQRKLNPKGMPCDSINLTRMENELRTMPLAASAECYILENGKVVIEIRQRVPLFHVKTAISDYCIDTEGHQMNTPKTLPDSTFKVSGDVTLEYAIEGLYPVLNYLNQSRDFRGEFIRVQVEAGNQVMLASRKYDYVVALGSAERYEQKLEKLTRFRQYDKKGDLQAQYQRIALQYRGQIVCKKKITK